MLLAIVYSIFVRSKQLLPLTCMAKKMRLSAGSGRPELVARIGVESGAVVDAAGEVFGDAPNIAARVQALAEPGSVLVTATVQRQTAGLFVAEDRGAHALKGAPEPTTLFRIVRASWPSPFTALSQRRRRRSSSSSRPTSGVRAGQP